MSHHVAAVCGAAILLVACGEERSKEPTPAAGESKRTSSGATSRFSDVRILARRRVETDGVSEGLAASLKGVDAVPELSRLALSVGGRTLFVVPARDGLCAALVSIPERGEGFTCHTRSLWKAGSANPGAVLRDCGSNAPPGCASLTLYDVVPDGVPTIKVDRKDAKSIVVPVTNNAYVVALRGARPSPFGGTRISYRHPRLGVVRHHISTR
jgi:hypothetical protein